MSGPVCRTATPREVAQMLDWAADEGWNPGLDDAAAFYGADPGGFFVAEIAGAPVAAISVVNHSRDYAFLGLYLCRPEHRGKGVGFGLWQHALDHAGARTVGLDGVPEQEANYARSGFVLTGRTRRLIGRLSAKPLTLPPARPEHIAGLMALDGAANGVIRPAFLDEWLRNGPTRKTVVLQNGAEITGFATARACHEGCKIGPIVAPNADDALHLAQQAAAALGIRDVIIDVPDHAVGFGGLLRGIGFNETFATARMYRGAPARMSGALCAVATLELG
ncbi:GNAT family N-acetyltransferase [Aliiroseovarius sp. PTFE2010]|uniref:GNAT family N-acetyltransferase n=1 Tax=Aliiroseovarius sp. PTFE2010 TaxID=3417190 RepID=UPI003CF18E6B